MTTSEEAVDKEWRALVALEPEKMQARMVEILTELNGLPESERAERRLAMARAEYDLTDDELRKFTVSRLRAWLTLDRAVAKHMSDAFDDVMKKISGTQAMRQVGLVQTLARDFSLEDQETLVELIPNVFGGAPIGLSVSQVVQEAPPPQPEAPAKPAKKWWWPFG